MINQASPGVVAREIDLTYNISAEGGVAGAFVGAFQWGPVEEVIPVSGGTDGVLQRFFRPNDDTAIYWLSLRDFLYYNDNALVVRLVGDNAVNAVPSLETAILVKNEDHFETIDTTGVSFIAKYPGVLGNGIGVYAADDTDYDNWAYADEFEYEPGTDEFNVVVVDTTGTWSGTAGTVLERYELMQTDSDAKKPDGTSAYVKDVINQGSNYVWMGDLDEFTFTDGEFEVVLENGVDDNELTEHVTGWNLFDNPSETDITEMVSINGATADIDQITTIAENRGDCVGFFSPELTSVYNNKGNERTDILEYRTTTTNKSSSYLFMDDNWKKVYDEFNDVYRWIPLSATSAGLHAEVMNSPQPWFSPAGYARGRVRNIIKLAWNSKKADRDAMYKKGINSYISEPGEGVILFGDKTQLQRPSAFNRINVRNLFIVVKKPIIRAAKYNLFELNDTITRSLFVNRTSAFLQSVQSGRGVYDYRVKADEENNTPQVIDSNGFVGSVFMKPARSINFIELNFVSTGTDINFEEVENAI